MIDARLAVQNNQIAAPFVRVLSSGLVQDVEITREGQIRGCLEAENGACDTTRNISKYPI